MSSRGGGDLATEHGDLLGKGVKDRSHDLELGRATLPVLSATCLLQPFSVAWILDARYTPATCSLLSSSDLTHSTCLHFCVCEHSLVVPLVLSEADAWVRTEPLFANQLAATHWKYLLFENERYRSFLLVVAADRTSAQRSRISQPPCFVKSAVYVSKEKVLQNKKWPCREFFVKLLILKYQPNKLIFFVLN